MIGVHFPRAAPMIVVATAVLALSASIATAAPEAHLIVNASGVPASMCVTVASAAGAVRTTTVEAAADGTAHLDLGLFVSGVYGVVVETAPREIACGRSVALGTSDVHLRCEAKSKMKHLDVVALATALAVHPNEVSGTGAEATVDEPAIERSNHVVIAGRVSGASGAHFVRVALWDSSHLFEAPVETVSIPPGSAPEFSFSVLPGEWAVSAFEDVNENGILDIGLLGPKEPHGFWRAFTGWRKPTFKDVSMTIERDRRGIEIHLQ